MLAVCSTATDTLLLSHHVPFAKCRSFRLLLLHSFSCSVFTVRPAGHSTAKIGKIHLFLPEETNFANFARLWEHICQTTAYISSHQLPVPLYNFKSSNCHLEDPKIIQKFQEIVFYCCGPNSLPSLTKGFRNFIFLWSLLHWQSKILLLSQLLIYHLIHHCSFVYCQSLSPALFWP